MSRAKNCAEPDRLARALRGATVQLDPVQFATLDVDGVLDCYCALICDILEATPRPVKKTLASATLAAFTYLTPDEADQFAYKICYAVSQAGRRMRNASSGKMMRPSLKQVVAKLQLVRQSTLSQSPSLPLATSSNSNAQETLEQGVDEHPDVPDEQPRVPKSRAEIFEAFGHAAKESLYINVIDSGSDFECQEVAEQMPPPTPPRMLLQDISSPKVALTSFVDRAINAMVRLRPDGSREIASMSQGPSGFAFAQFGDEEPMETEIPNVVAFASQGPQVMAKQKAGGKPQAKAKAKSVANARPVPVAKVHAKEKPKAEAKPKAKAKQKAQAKSKTKGGRIFHSESFGDVHLTLGTAQSYICAKANGQKKLLAAISSIRDGDHQTSILKVLEFALKPNLTKDQVLQFRDDLLKP